LHENGRIVASLWSGHQLDCGQITWAHLDDATMLDQDGAIPERNRDELPNDQVSD
jgi:hypothetical protein